MNKTGKTVLTIISVLLILALLAGIIGTGVATNGFTDWSGFAGEEAETEGYPAADRSGGVVTESGEVLESGNVYPLPARMAFTSVTRESALADNGVTVQATVLPQDATNREVDWSLSWASPASSWASGKTVTDYVTVTPSSDGSTTATVRCLQAFGAQIRLTVTSRDNPDAAADTMVDYYKRAASFRAEFTGRTSDDSGNTTFTCMPGATVELPCHFRSNEYFETTGSTIDTFMDLDFATAYKVSSWETGTVEDDSYDVTATVRLTDGIKEEILAEASDYGHGIPATALDGTMDVSQVMSMGYNDVMKYLCCYELYETEEEIDELVMGFGMLGWLDDIIAVVTVSDTPFMQVDIEAVSANTGDTYTVVYYVTPDKDYLYVAAESVNITSGGELKF